MKSFWKPFILKLISIFAVIALDLFTKHIFYGVNQDFLPYIIGFRQADLNTGGAWSILSDKTWLLTVLTIVFIISVFIFDFCFKNKSKLYSISFAFIVGGAIGNLIDRLLLGGVRDFLFFEFAPNFPTFNVADSFLCIGMILLAYFIIFIYKTDDEKKTNNQQLKH